MSSIDTNKTNEGGMMNKQLSAKVVSYTKPVDESISNATELVAFIARISNPDNQNNHLTSEKLINYLLKHKHFSPFEHYSLTIEIECPKDIAVQILRHRSFKFQEFCIAGDSLVTTITKCGRTKKVAIADLYKRYQSKQYWDMSDNLVRVFDESDKMLKPVRIKEVFETGVKPVYMMTLDNGRKIKSTLEHKFLAKDGFKQLSEITVNDFVASNGVAVYQDYEWLKAAKDESVTNGTGVQGIADKAGVSYHTIRKWLKRLNLSFTHKEVASYTEVWNKNLPSELQPMYGKNHSEETRDKMKDASLKGVNSGLYSTGGNARRSYREQVADYWYKRKLALYNANSGLCSVSGKPYDISELEIDHIKPVSQNPELAYEPSNIRLVHKYLHMSKTVSESATKQMTITWQKVVSIEYIGDEQTYDLEVEHESHNYVANGIVTHNSQRYADVTQMGFTTRECRLQDTKNRQNSIDTDNEILDGNWQDMQNEIIRLSSDMYTIALNAGIAKEQARALLPIGLTMSRLYMTGDIRSWLHYLAVRLDPTTQKEHRQLAALIKDEVSKYFDLGDMFGEVQDG